MTRKPDPFATQLEKYMAKSGIHFEGPRKLVAYHVAQFAHRKRRRIRRGLRLLLLHEKAHADWKCDHCAWADEIDSATKARR